MELDLPGFRFHPTEEELLEFYLKHMIRGKKLQLEVITTINIYRHDPWELPGLARIGEREWYFYVPRDRKQASGGRPSRTTKRGFWKATGYDRPVRSAADPKWLIGLKKTLVYYEGRAPRGTKTDWVMNEYRLPGPPASSSDAPPKEEDIVLCKIYRKAASMKELEQRAAVALEEETAASQVSGSVADSSPGWSDQDVFQLKSSYVVEDDVIFTAHTKEVEVREEAVDVPGASTRRPCLPELEVPRHEGLEWLQDPFLTQLRSPWMVDLWSPYDPSILNF
ncbi:hypothetical protein B296_00023818 [Ensete ventricosum]|uniref:NAC domain-containing protein n=1 Tax=Ensete ventricosum TaxID=4639 RepID=A0A427AJA4_ENSVE|nr:hypothetical protein B296_00023818 [Ensete ventricosum]